jgi:hypothetical protein
MTSYTLCKVRCDSLSLLNTVRFGWSRIFITAQNFDASLTLPTQLGIPGVIVPGDEAPTDGMEAPIRINFRGGSLS